MAPESGFALDENFDLTLSSGGSLALSQGSDEIEKDIAIRIRAGINPFLNQPTATLRRSVVRSSIEDAIRGDERVNSVRVNQFEITDNIINVDIEVSTNITELDTTITTSQ